MLGPGVPSPNDPARPLLSDEQPHFRSTYGPPLVVALVALILGVVLYGRFLEDSRHLWTVADHDRNAHYLTGLNVALDLRHGNVVLLLHELDGARIWGPLHGFVLGLVLAVAGTDYRLAVLPSLLAWMGCALLGFLIARRAVPRGGNLAGAVAAVFFLASPAYRAFATDIMLESSGACLTLLALYLYLVTRQSQSIRAARGFGLALTALFLLKYNYWVLALIPLAFVEVFARGWAGLQHGIALLVALPWRPWFRAQWRHPLNYLLVIVLGLGAVVLLGHKEAVTIWGHTFQMRSIDNLAHLAYVILFLRALPWWWRQGRQWARQLPYPFPQFLAWDGLPIALWFLLPKRPSYFFRYLTRNHGGEVEQHDRLAAASFYWHSLVGDYHVNLASVLLALGLIGVALLAWRKLRPGGLAVLGFLLLAAFLAVLYPSHRSRFLHSWLASMWVVAGIGLSQLVYGRLTSVVVKQTPPPTPLPEAERGGAKSEVLALSPGSGPFLAGHAGCHRSGAGPDAWNARGRPRTGGWSEALAAQHARRDR